MKRKNSTFKVGLKRGWGKALPGKTCGRNSASPQGTHFISDPPFQNMGPNIVQEKGVDTLDHCHFPLFKKNLYFIKKIPLQADKIKTS